LPPLLFRLMRQNDRMRRLCYVTNLSRACTRGASDSVAMHQNNHHHIGKIDPQRPSPQSAKMRLVRQSIDRKTMAGSATLTPEEPEDMVSKFVFVAQPGDDNF